MQWTPELYGKLMAADDAYSALPNADVWLPTSPSKFLDALEAARMEVQALESRIGPSGSEHARRTLVRAAAFETGAIEALYETSPGMTVTVALGEVGWEDVARQESGLATIEHFNAQLGTYLDLQALAPETRPLSEVLVRQVHEDISAGQSTYTVLTQLGKQEQPLPRGTYKLHSNHVYTRFNELKAYCPVARTSDEMARLIEEARSAAFVCADAVAQASFIHWALTSIHPFADGNGRVARALASQYLLSAYGVPLIVYTDRKGAYVRALELADEGNSLALVDHLALRVLDALHWQAELLETMSSPPALAELAILEAVLLEQSETARVEAPGTSASRVHAELMRLCTEGVDRLNSTTKHADSVTLKASPGSNWLPSPDLSSTCC